VKVPANKKLFSAMDQASGHFRRYDPEDLGKLARRTELEAVELRYINAVGALVYRLRNKKQTNFSRTFQPRQLRTINAALPILSALDSLCSRFLWIEPRSCIP